MDTYYVKHWVRKFFHTWEDFVFLSQACDGEVFAKFYK